MSCRARIRSLSMVSVSGTEVTEDSVVALRCLVSGCGLLDLLKLALLPALGFGTAEPRDEEYRCQCQFRLFLASIPPHLTYKSRRRCAQHQYVRFSHLW